uniref:Dynein light intermediate chain n=1 Tax=Petromyzon marinus TaxID=7757 RepID=A0AAJ7U0I4_PETMA|nr:cytoplasmic dynein 1 light intermediate chain 1-like isoform X1 [Petromyzon marinus]
MAAAAAGGGGRRDEDAEAAFDGHSSNEDEGQNLWLSILSEVSTRSRSKLPAGKSIFVLGEDGSGKTSLIAKLQGAEDARKGRGLEYLYLNIHDEDRDDHARCNVWLLDGDVYHKGLLRFAATRENARDSLVLLVADLARPWLIMETLEKWSQVMREHLDSLAIPHTEQRDMEHNLVRDFQSYAEPGEEGSLASPRRTHATAIGEGDEESEPLPLGENTLTHNLGIPVVVVCTKSDAVNSLEKEYDYREEHFDFMQSHIRRFCLRYGAALIYTSLKEDKNVDLLYRYLLHRLYDFPFRTTAHVVEKDSVFIPAGWDNEKKIAILHEHFQTVRPEDCYEEIIVKPPVRKWVQEKEVTVEDEQVFLMKQQALLSKVPASTAGRPMDVSGGSPRAVSRPGQTNVASVSPLQTPGKKLDPANIKGGATSEGVLANFFNSLLTKKGASPGGPPSPGQAASPGNAKPLVHSAHPLASCLSTSVLSPCLCVSISRDHTAPHPTTHHRHPHAPGGETAPCQQGPKPAMTDVQAELDRLVRKPDSPAAQPTPSAQNEVL